MKASEKIKGIVYAYNTSGEYDMVRELGVEWMRLNIPFPWKDRMYGELADEYISARQGFYDTHAEGFEMMPSTPGMGGWVYDADVDATVWKDSWPDFVGEKGTEEYYENVRRTLQFIAEDLGEAGGMYWQIMNEIDIPTFSNDYPIEVVTGTARASAEGVLRANPNARCGITIAGYNENAVRYMDYCYAPGHSFYYVGVDQYFGSWQDGDVYDWIPVIDTVWDRYHLPVLANEWGYSSDGEYSEVRPDPAEIPEGLPDVCYAQKWFHQIEGGHTPEVQAKYFEEGLKLFAEHPHCIGSFMFCWRDAYHCYHCGGESCPAEDFWGLVTKDLKKKPAYYSVQKALKDYYAE